MKTTFCTLATGEYYSQGGTGNLIKSAAKFHPDIPFIVFSDAEIEAIHSRYIDLVEQMSLELPPEIRPEPPYRLPEMGFYHALIGKLLSEEFDLIIYIDCDSLIVAPLTEVFSEDYEIACVRNIADNGKAGKFDCQVDGLDALKYVNGGFTACRRKDFWSHWALLNLKFNFETHFAEQYTLNVLFHSGIYKTLLLDSIEKDVYYGNASTYGEVTHWDSWQRIVIDGDLLKLDNKTIKILHEAGGTHLPKMDLDSDLLPRGVSQWIKERILS